MGKVNLLETCTHENLQIVTRFLIEEKCRKSQTNIKIIFNNIFKGSTKSNKEKIDNPEFLKLIKIFHPDSVTKHLNTIKAAILSDNKENLEYYKHIASVIVMVLERNIKSKTKEDKFDFKPEYSYDINDFDDNISYDELDGNDDIYKEFIDDEFDFISAFKSEFLSSADNIIVTPSMLAMTSGFLDFSNLSIMSLSGLEHCIYIDRLNLSHNQIDNIYEIQYLYQLTELYLSHNMISCINEISNLKGLEILDLSNNDIDNFDPILVLENLKIVSIFNNPGDQEEIRKSLNRKGIVVI